MIQSSQISESSQPINEQKKMNKKLTELNTTKYS